MFKKVRVLPLIKRLKGIHILQQQKIKVRYTNTLQLRSVRRFAVLDGKLNFSELEKSSYAELAQKNAEEYSKNLAFVMAGGGESAIIRHTQKNKKLLPRDRIKRLIDPDYPMMELGSFAGLGMDYGDICAAGNICVIAKISGQLCIIGANDATVKGGTVYPIGVKKQLRMQEIAEENKLPCVYLMDSGGGFLPLQSEVFPSKDHGGRVFYNEAIMNSLGIPQICLVAGSCTAGAAYIPTMANEVVMVDKIGTIFLAGPPLVYAAIGEQISDQDLGGADVHCDVSGCADYKARDELEAIEMTKDVMSTLNVETHLHGNMTVEQPFYESHDLEVLSVARDAEGKLYIRTILSRIVDGSRFHEYKPTYGKELLTGFAHVNGILVGIVANNGQFTPQSCLKGSNFVSLCNERGIPVIFFQDILNNAEESENNTKLIKYQAEFMSSVATAKVPKITFILGSSFGVGNYIMCGRSMSPRFLFMWPSAKVSIDHEENMRNDSALYADMGQVEHTVSCYFSSGRIWDDGVVLPDRTRQYLILSLNACLTYNNVERSSDQNVLRM